MSELYDILTETPPTKVVLLALDQGLWDCERSLAELSALCEANHMEAVAQITQKRQTPETGIVLGSGKLEEASLAAQTLGAECAVFDGELTGSQIRNISNALGGLEVIDRTMLILEIFRSRAVTNEGKLQTELALLRYRLPRLQGMGEALSRQGGGGGGGGGARRGAGETKLELDRRHVHARIDALAEKLAEMEKRRGESRKARAKTGMPVVSLVGYTNVGKSSLMNALCGPSVAEADMLFATLDPTSRKLVLPSGMAVLLVDTVGFVSRLPHNLVEAFKSTLEEAAWSDVIVRVADAGDEQREEQLAVTDEVLDGLDCTDIPRLTVYNKCDKPNTLSFDPDILLTSAKTGYGLDKLLQKRSEPAPLATKEITLPEYAEHEVGTVPQLAARFETAAQLPGSEYLAKLRYLILPIREADAVPQPLRCKTLLELPRAAFGTVEPDTMRRLAALEGSGFAGVVANNLAQFGYASPLPVFGGLGLNVTNPMSAAEYVCLGACGLLVQPETALTAMRAVAPRQKDGTPVPTAALCYGHLPLMLTRACPLRNVRTSCAGCTHKGKLRDRKGRDFPVRCSAPGSAGMRTVFNPVPLYMGDRLTEMPVDLAVAAFTLEPADRVEDVLTHLFHRQPFDGEFTRGLYYTNN